MKRAASILLTLLLPFISSAETVDIYASGGTGQLRKSAGSFMSARGSSWADTKSSGPGVGNDEYVQFGSFNQFEIQRGFLTFDTTSIPVGAAISEAVLYLRRAGTGTELAFSLDVVSSQQANPASLSLSDFGSVGTVSGGHRTASTMPSTGYGQITLNNAGRAWVKPGQWTLLALRHRDDLNGIAPTSVPEDEYVDFQGTSRAFPPYLKVTYTSSGGPLPAGFVTPTNGATIARDLAGLPTSVQFKWPVFPGATQVQFEFNDDWNTTAEITAPTLSGTATMYNASLGASIPNGVFHARVRGKLAGGQWSPYTTVSNLQVQSAPPVPNPTAPANAGTFDRVRVINFALSNPAEPWGTPSQADTFELQVSRNSTYSQLVKTESWSAGPSTTVSRQIDFGAPLAVGQHFWRARCKKSDHSLWSGWTATRMFIIQDTPLVLAPAAPVLNATPGNGVVNLFWNAVPDATEYQVRRSPDGVSFPFSLTGTTFENTTVINGTTYSYRVAAKNTAGFGPESNVVVTTPIGPPPVPQNVVAIGGNFGVTVRWSASQGATSYIVRRAVTEGGSFSQVATPTAPTYPDTGLINETLYRYVIQSVGPNGTSAESAVAEARPMQTEPNPSPSVNGTNNQCANGADPINLSTGNYHYSRTDISVPSVGFGFNFTRTYNVMGRTDGVFGWGWRHSYQISAVEQGDSTVIIIWGDGREETYDPQGGGTYLPRYQGYEGELTKTGSLFTFTKKNRMRYQFDADGDLAQIVDRNANTLTINYLVSPKRIASITDTAGRIYTLAYNAEGRIATISDPALPTSRVWQYTYSPEGDLVQILTPGAGTPYVLAYDGTTHLLKTMSDRRGILFLDNDYDAQDRVIRQEMANEGVYTVVYDDVAHETHVTDPAGKKMTYAHDLGHRLQLETDPLGHSTDTNYDDNNRPTSMIDPRGNPTTFVNDEHGNRLATSNALNQSSTTTYDANNRPVESRDALNRVTGFEYDPVTDNLEAIVHSDGSRTEYGYFANGLMRFSQQVGPPPLSIVSNRTDFEYDARGNQTHVTNADGTERFATFDNLSRMLTSSDGTVTTTMVYDDADNIISTTVSDGGAINYTTSAMFDNNRNPVTRTNALGVVTSFHLDAHDNVTTTTIHSTNPPMDIVTQNVYDELDRVKETIDARGMSWFTDFDDAGRVKNARDPLGNAVKNTFDPAGNLVAVENPNGNVTRTTFDVLNRPVSMSDAEFNLTSTVYDGGGRVQFTVDALGNKTETEYDDRDRPIKVTDGAGNTVQFEYDEDTGNRIAIIDGNDQRWEFEYYTDGTNRLRIKRDPNGREWEYAYDSKGRLWIITGPDLVTKTMTYDALGRLKTITYSDGTPNVTDITYDKNSNRRTVAVAGLGTWTYDYDDLDRLISVIDCYGQEVKYEYLATGQVSKITYPDNKEVTYTYDDAGRLIGVTAWYGPVATITRDAAGNILTIAFGNGTIHRRAYDRAERLVEVSHEYADGTKFFRNRITLDGNGNHLYHDRTEPVGRTMKREDIAYVHDPANRAISATDQFGPDDSFDWELAGNAITITTDGVDSTAAYDAENRLIDFTSPSFTLVNTWGADGQRIGAVRNGVASRYVIDPNGPLDNVLCEMTDADAITAYYIHAPGIGLLARVSDADAVTYYHGDHLGSVAAITDDSATLVQAYAYDEFGATEGQLTGLVQPFTFVGLLGVQQETSRLLFMRARYYDVTMGRFLQKDPAEQFTSPYLYGVPNPLVTVDPSGTEAVTIFLAGWGIKGLVATGVDIYEAKKALDRINEDIDWATSQQSRYTEDAAVYWSVESYKASRAADGWKIVTKLVFVLGVDQAMSYFGGAAEFIYEAGKSVIEIGAAQSVQEEELRKKLSEKARQQRAGKKK